MYSKYKDYLEQPQRELKTWKAALYIRLSREDGDKSESYSITSQREILKEYLKLHPDIEAHQLAEKLDKLGWKVSVAKCPIAIRVVLMNHIKKSHLKKLLEDLEKIY